MKEINTTQTLVPVGFWRRMAAVWTDGWLTCLLIMNFLYSITLTNSWNITAWDELLGENAKLLDYLMFILSDIFRALYIAIFESSTLQATPGCYFRGIKILNNDGTPLGFYKSFFRTLSFSILYGITTLLFFKILSFSFLYSSGILCFIIVIINIACVIYDDQKRFLHDIVFRTRMVRR